MGMGGGGGDRHTLQSDINVTPLVDVCLVLLIIFMVVTPMLQKGIPIQLPVTDNPDKKPENAKQKLITVAWGDPPKYYIETKWLPKEDFQKELDEMYQRDPSAELVIKADQRLKYREVKEVMRITKEAGFQDVGLIVDRKQKGTAG
ncbi:MAG TPA: biopolymer transporter ExbD [Thermoanaerobaculia bacterium]|nr:biopolymer transporter ExbD [Thermoanaerobaculia bacterium]